MEWACRNFRFRHAYALALHADSCIKAGSGFFCLNEVSLAFGKRTFDFIHIGISIFEQPGAWHHTLGCFLSSGWCAVFHTARPHSSPMRVALSLFQPCGDVQNGQSPDLGVNILFPVTAEDGAGQGHNPGRIGRRDRDKRLSPSGCDIQLDDLLRDG
jgi:hypothetical protein